MISSMTGFGKGSSSDINFTADSEIKSVNSRFLEISLKLPKSLQSKEYEFREIIRNKIKRGKLNVNIQLSKNGAEETDLSLNPDNVLLALNYLKEIKQISQLNDEITLSHILNFQNLFTAETVEETEKEFEVASQALNLALDQLIEMRGKEGCELSKDLSMRVRNIETAVNEIEQYYKEAVTEAFEKLKERVQQLIENSSAYNERLEMELALLVDKSDVTEECVRLKSHIKFFLENLSGAGEVGRKLNFLCQEINREANTIGSKALSAQVSHQTVFIKEELEKIREQIQNIE